MDETATPPPPATPAGWYIDSDGRMRWWDGQAWTDAYAPVAAPTAPMNPFSVLGFVLGLVALVLFAAGPVALGVGVLGLVASITGYADRIRRGRGFAVAGIVLCGVAIVLGLLSVLRAFTGQ
jgi:energy-coupling factor transporter transmembrane protein EcfT